MYPMPYYQPQSFLQYPQFEMAAHQQIKQPLYPHKQHCMIYLIGRVFDRQTTYAIVASWETNEMF